MVGPFGTERIQDPSGNQMRPWARIVWPRPSAPRAAESLDPLVLEQAGRRSNATSLRSSDNQGGRAGGPAQRCRWSAAPHRLVPSERAAGWTDAAQSLPRQIRRSDSLNSFRTWSMQARRRARPKFPRAASARRSSCPRIRSETARRERVFSASRSFIRLT